MTVKQTRLNIINLAARLLENATKIRYGSVSATLKIHDGRIVDVTHSKTENTREQQEQEKEKRR
ncbi:MAG: DUF2292 domain-containing protein [Treponema sp.]|nr:DUF2292 domain-containing protein [Treponema sp.]